MLFRFESESGVYSVQPAGDDFWVVRSHSGEEFPFRIMIRETDRIFPGPVSSFQDESGETGYFFRSGDKVYLHRNGKTFVGRWEERELGSGSQVALEIRSPMPGKIIQINRGVGDEFQPGEVLAVLEAMKMENQLKAAFHGRIRSLRKTLGDLVSQDEIIIELEPIEADS